MDDARFAHAFQRSLTAELARLHAARAAALADLDPTLEHTSTRRRGIPSTGAPPTTPDGAEAVHRIIEQLDERIERLSQVRDWMTQDNELVRLIDSTIGQQVHAAERRQMRLSVVLTILSLMAGWLLSLVGSPATLFHR